MSHTVPAGQEQRPIGITMGDAAGIGPEIIVRLFSEGLPCPAVVYGDAGVLAHTIDALQLSDRLRVEAIDRATSTPSDGDVIPVLNRRRNLLLPVQPGVACADAGRAAYEYVCHAIDDALEGLLRAVVTAPLNKHAMQLGGVDYPGHTEILAERTGTQDYAMLLANHELRVILVTIHIALKHVPAHITKQAVLRTIELAHHACQQAGIAKPRIAVAGLNPHAGEEGRFGQEEIEHINPAIRCAQDQGMDVSGPWPGDTVFMRARQGEFDIVVAQYHDQGLIPVKYLGLDEGVNMTVGLPFVRTSVDHGTAFDIAGKGIADPRSLQAAVTLALSMTQGAAAA